MYILLFIDTIKMHWQLAFLQLYTPGISSREYHFFTTFLVLGNIKHFNFRKTTSNCWFNLHFCDLYITTEFNYLLTFINHLSCFMWWFLRLNTWSMFVNFFSVYVNSAVTHRFLYIYDNILLFVLFRYLYPHLVLFIWFIRVWALWLWGIQFLPVVLPFFSIYFQS